MHNESSDGADKYLLVLSTMQIASPVQAAKCLVQSFPWYPGGMTNTLLFSYYVAPHASCPENLGLLADSLCIITWVAAEAGDADAAELLQYKPPTVDQHSEQDSAGNVSDSPSRSP